MAAPAAISATFSDFRIVKGRKVAQLVFEVPLESADAALETLGGLPRPDREAHCGIARLAKKPETPARQERTTGPAPNLAQRVAIKCQDADFRRYLAQRGRWKGVLVLDTVSAAADVRDICGVSSRSEIVPGSEAARKWEALEAEYIAWRSGRR